METGSIGNLLIRAGGPAAFEDAVLGERNIDAKA
jgi:hypothetical protein